LNGRRTGAGPGAFVAFPVLRWADAVGLDERGVAVLAGRPALDQVLVPRVAEDDQGGELRSRVEREPADRNP